MYFTYISMMLSFIGSVFVSNSQFANKEWAVCAVTIGWLGMSLGVLMFVALLLMRIYRYINVFLLKRRATGIYFIIPVAYLVAVSTLYAVLSFVINPKSGYSYDPKTNMCVVATPLYVVGVVLLAIQGIIMCVMLVKARKMECCFNEYKIMIITVGVCFVAGIIILVLRFVKIGSDNMASGILKIIFMFIPQQVYFFLILGPPIYHSLRDSEEYLAYFIDTIEKRGLSPIYEMAGKCTLGEISGMSEYGQSRNISMQSGYTQASRFSGNVPAPSSDKDANGENHGTRNVNQASTFSFTEN
ncbi:hypothetical protein H4R99_001999 [Coemansia sp. RSA 1722]|nr:hypothetical protein IWW45_004455 [Coemansia sp. RSA 485]KAJ2602246.1 hypothetical protein GGF39_000838 [Coemansia sp. RSA 1721]KAJ2604130.1 hypothetical protein H4R99_001999 [Coemansia sp. RSA 1722]